jgi:hypothetical protein
VLAYHAALRPGTAATEAEIIGHGRPRLAACKLPRPARFVADNLHTIHTLRADRHHLPWLC